MYSVESFEITVTSGYFLMALIMAIRAAISIAFLSPSISRLIFNIFSKSSL